MKIQVIQHIAFENPGSIVQWAVSRGHQLEFIHIYKGDSLPKIHETEALLIIGGTMGAYEDETYHWMRPEKEFIKTVMEAGKPVLGICLGSQLLASVLGAAVFKHRHPEIGWHEVFLTSTGQQSPFFRNCPSVFKTMHWHNDTFELPAGAEWLAWSEGTPNQAFSFGTNVLGLQFHPEFDAELIETLCTMNGDDLQPDTYVQSAEQILRKPELIQPANELMAIILDNFFGK
jgi:GMP synthase-like glutamine amidotransferase